MQDRIKQLRITGTGPLQKRDLPNIVEIVFDGTRVVEINELGHK